MEKDESVSIHHKNIQIIAKEMCKVKNVSLPKIFSYLFCETEITLLEDSNNLRVPFETKCSRMDQVKLAEDSL